MIQFGKIKEHVNTIAWYFGASLIPMLLSLATNPWIAKNMSPEDYAIAGFYTSFSALISPIILFYMVHYYIKEYFRLDENGRELLLSLIAKALIWFSGIVSMVCFILLYVYLRFISEPLSFAISPYLAMMVFSLPLTGLFYLRQTKLRMEKKPVAYFKISVINGALTTALTLLFVVGIKWGAFGKLLGPLIGNTLIFIYLLSVFRKELRLKTNIGEFRKIFVFCLPLAASAMLGYFNNGFSTTYLESIGNVNEYGIYVIGASIGTYVSVFASAVINTFQPDCYKAIIERTWKKYVKLCVLQVVLVGGIVMLFIILAPFIISILTAGRYESSTPYAQIISLSSVVSTMYFMINNFSIATNHPRHYLYTTIIGSIIIVLLMPVAVRHLEFYGGAWMTVASYIFFSIINIILLFISKTEDNNHENTLDN